jgi:hypothetical protein
VDLEVGDLWDWDRILEEIHTWKKVQVSQIWKMSGENFPEAETTNDMIF